MARWKGSNDVVKRTSVIDLTGTSFNERHKTNTRNLDDIIHYLEYAKDSGYQAARVDQEQEEYWATLIRHLLMDKVIRNLIPLYEEIGCPPISSKILGIRFTCSNCGCEGEMRFTHSNFKVGMQDGYEITQHCNCGVTKSRENDIIEYLKYVIQKWCKIEKLESVGDLQSF